jgi:hypothetical protein
MRLHIAWPRALSMVAVAAFTSVLAACSGSTSQPSAGASPGASPFASPVALASNGPGLGFASPLPGTVASPGPTLPMIDYNVRLGSNRPAAEAALAISRDLFSDGSFWEVYVKTTPVVINSGYDPTDPSSYIAAGRSVKSIDLIMATESGVALNKYRAGGHDHERTVMSHLMTILLQRFPGVHVTFNVYFGETDHHATGTYDKGRMDYKVLDTL